MTIAADSENVTADEAAASPSASPSAARLPYLSPRLRRLGSVRELTLGASGNAGDGLGAKKHVGM